jgi:hypothetical protein
VNRRIGVCLTAILARKVVVLTEHGSPSPRLTRQSSLLPTDWDITVPEPSHPDVAFAKIFDFHFDLLWFLIPMFIFRKAFERHFRKQIPGIAQMHLSRLAYQWEVRINKAIENIRDQALKYVQEELSTIDALLSRTAGQSGTIQKTIIELEEQVREVERGKTGT